MNSHLLGIHALAAVLRAIPQARSLESVANDVAAVLGDLCSEIDWRRVVNEALVQQVIVRDAEGWRPGPDLDDVPAAFQEIEDRARRLAQSREDRRDDDGT